MKKLIVSTILGISLLTIPVGCGTTSPKQPVAIVYLSLGTVQNGVSKLMETYGIKRAQGKVSDAQREKIKESYTLYQNAFNSAIELAKFNYSAAAPEDVVRLADQLETLIFNL